MRKSPIRWLARFILSCCLIGALAVSAFNIWTLAQSPAGAAFTDRTSAQVRAATERALLDGATPDRIAARITALLDEDPRDWHAINALETLAQERGIPLPPDLVAHSDGAYDTDHGVRITAQKCVRCALDASTCAVSAILFCRAPVDLTVIGDIAGLTRGATDALTGQTVDRIDVTLSAIGLSAVALSVASGGSSLSIKAGAGFAKMARSMNRLPAAITDPLMQAARNGMDWTRLRAARSTADVSSAMKPDVLRPATSILDDAGRMVRSTSTLDGLHLMKYVDDPADLSRMARASDALGPRTTGVIETLGKSRFLRLTMRVANEVWLAAAGLIAGLAALLALAESAITSAVLRVLRRLA